MGGAAASVGGFDDYLGSQVMRSISIRFIYGERKRQPLMWCGATIARA